MEVTFPGFDAGIFSGSLQYTVYRGSNLALQRGRYFYGDFCNGTVWSFRYANGKVSGKRKEAFTVPTLSSFGEGSGGELYMCDLNDGRVYKLV